jgi:hypothetical protein
MELYKYSILDLSSSSSSKVQREEHGEEIVFVAHRISMVYNTVS